MCVCVRLSIRHFLHRSYTRLNLRKRIYLHSTGLFFAGHFLRNITSIKVDRFRRRPTIVEQRSRGRTVSESSVHLATANMQLKQGRKEMFYLTTHSTHFIYGYMASGIW